MAYPERTLPFHIALRPRTLPGAFPPAERVIAAYQDHLLAELRTIDERSVTLAAWRESRTLLIGLRAPIYSGDVTGQVRVDFNSALRYELNLTASRIDLQKFGKHNLGPKSALDGESA